MLELMVAIFEVWLCVTATKALIAEARSWLVSEADRPVWINLLGSRELFSKLTFKAVKSIPEVKTKLSVLADLTTRLPFESKEKFWELKLLTYICLKEWSVDPKLKVFDGAGIISETKEALRLKVSARLFPRIRFPCWSTWKYFKAGITGLSCLKPCLL